MSVNFSDGPAIVIGYRYKVPIEADAALFPAGATFTAHVRSKVTSTDILATLTTANGGLLRISDTQLEITISAAQSAGMAAGTVELDIVRTDVSPIQHLGFALKIPVMQPVTRGL